MFTSIFIQYVQTVLFCHIVLFKFFPPRQEGGKVRELTPVSSVRPSPREDFTKGTMFKTGAKNGRKKMEGSCGFSSSKCKRFEIFLGHSMRF